MHSLANTNIKGHVLITDGSEVLLDKFNQINSINFSSFLARCIMGQSTSVRPTIKYMKLGNGGTYSDSNGNLIYNTPNTASSVSKLYNTTFTAEISNISSKADATLGANIVINVVLDSNAPAGQRTDDTSGGVANYTSSVTSNAASPFKFDEIGLFDEENNMLTHIIFSPVEKTANRAINITYTLQIVCN